MRRQFSLFRLMLAVTVFAFLFGLTSLLWPMNSIISIGISFLVSACWAIIIIIANDKDVMRITWSVMCTGIGIFLGSFFMTFSVRSQHKPPLETYYPLIIGAIIGWTIGGILARWDEKVHRKIADRAKNNLETNNNHRQ
jgi:hypothetical protein